MRPSSLHLRAGIGLAALFSSACTAAAPQLPPVPRVGPTLAVQAPRPRPDSTTAPVPPPPPPAGCRPPSRTGSLHALARLPADQLREFATPILFDGAPFDLAPTGGGWPYLQAAYLASRGEYLAVWTQEPQPPDTEGGLYVQRLDREGRPLAPASRLSTGRFDFPKVLALDGPEAGYMLAWTDGLSSTAYMWRLDGAASPQGEPGSLGAATGNPVPVYNARRQEVFVAWTATAAQPGCPFQPGALVGRRFAPDGKPLAPATTLLAAPTGLYSYNLAYNAAHEEYLLAWTSSDDYGLYTRQLAADGTAASELRPLPVGGAPRPSVLSAFTYHPGLDEFLLLWGEGPEGHADLFAHRLGRDGAPLDAPIRVTVAPEDERPDRVLPTADGYLVTFVRTVTTRYENGESTASGSAFGQRLAGGARLGAEVDLNLGGLGIGVAAGDRPDTFLAFARDTRMRARKGHLPLNSGPS